MIKKIFLYTCMTVAVMTAENTLAQNFFLGASQSDQNSPAPATTQSSSQVMSASEFKKNADAAYQKKQQLRNQQMNNEMANKLSKSPNAKGFKPATPAPTQPLSDTYSSSPPPTNKTTQSESQYTGFQGQTKGSGNGGNSSNPSGGGFNIQY